MVAGSKFRFVAELSVALIAVMLLIASIVSPDWVETLTGASPDNGDGGVEWGAALVAAAVFVGMTWFAARDWRVLSKADGTAAADRNG